MLQLAAMLLVIAIVAAVFGFGGFVSGAVAAAKILFVIFLIGVSSLLSWDAGVCSFRNAPHFVAN